MQPSLSLNPENNDTQENGDGSENGASRPSKPATPFTLFFRNQQQIMKTSKPDISYAEVLSASEAAWQSLPADEKNVYKQNFNEEKRKYAILMAEYKAKTNPPTENGDSENPILLELIADPDDDDLVWGDADDSSQAETRYYDASDKTEADDPIQNASDASNSLKCVRFECENMACPNSEWDNEFCSSECVVKHCQTVFENFFATRNNT